MLQKAANVAEVLAAEEQRRKRRRRLLLAALALTAVSTVFGAWWWMSQSRQRLEDGYVTEPVSRADIRVVVVATGTLEPTGEAAVSSMLGGTVASVDARPNATVARGQVLARIDMADVEARLMAAMARAGSQQANLQIADTNLSDAQADLARAQALSAGQTVSMRDLEMASSAVRRAQAQQALAAAQLRIAEADLAAAQNDFDKACICSPIDGVVLEANVTRGQSIISTTVGQPLFRIAEDLSRLDLQVNIDEADIGRVQQDDVASFVVEAWPRQVFSGTIREVRFSPSIVEGVVSYLALLDVDNEQMLLRPGMTATADIVVDEVSDVLVVPNAALRFTPDAEDDGSPFDEMMFGSTLPDAGDQQAVWVLRDGALRQVPVTLGLADGQHSQVTTGELQEGDPVVVGRTSP